MDDDFFDIGHDSFDEELQFDTSMVAKSPTRKDDDVGELTRRYEELNEQMEEIDELARQLRSALLICRQMEQCYSDRIEQNGPDKSSIVTDLELRYMSNGAILLILQLTNTTEECFTDWTLGVSLQFVFDDSDEYDGVSSQTLQIRRLPSKASATYELCVAGLRIRFPFILELTLLRLFKIDDFQKVIRVKIDSQPVTAWSFAKVRSSSMACDKPLIVKSASGNKKQAVSKFSALGSFSLRLPHTLVDLLNGKPDKIHSGLVFRVILPPILSASIHLETSQLECLFPDDDGSWHDVQLDVERAPTYYTLGVSSRESEFRNKLKSQLLLHLVLRMSQLKLLPEQNKSDSNIQVMNDHSTIESTFNAMVEKFL